MELLLQKIKREQIRRKEKRPYRHSSFSVVSIIVEKYQLGEEFLKKLSSVPAVPSSNSFINGPLKGKKELELPPFVLSESANYTLTRKILDVADNRYLPYARSPDEIIISRRLFTLNPSISPRLLQVRHFETLYFSVLARKRIRELSAAMAETVRTKTGRKSAGDKNGYSELGPCTAKTTRLQIKALEDFIFFVENPNGMEID